VKDEETGEEKDVTGWVAWNAWRETAEQMQSLNKGDAVLLIGKAESRTWKDKEGNDRESAELTVYSMALPVYKRKDAGFSAKTPPSRQPAVEAEDHSSLPF
jgi:single-stranded DNA-binding protein